MANENKWNKLLAIAKEFNQRNLWLYSTSGAYYLFLSLGPLVAIVLGLLPYMPFSEQELMDTLLHYTPEPFQELINRLVEGVYAGSAAALGFGLLIELWSAGKAFGLILRTIELIFDGYSHGGYLHRRIMGSIYTGALICLILGNMILLFVGEKLLEWVGLGSTATQIWSFLLKFREVFFFVIVTLLNILLYSRVPLRTLTFRQQLPGAIFASAAWLIFSHIYSWAVTRFGIYSIYGGLAIVIISLFWMYISLYLLFIGGWLNIFLLGIHTRDLQSEPPSG